MIILRIIFKKYKIILWVTNFIFADEVWLDCGKEDAGTAFVWFERAVERKRREIKSCHCPEGIIGFFLFPYFAFRNYGLSFSTLMLNFMKSELWEWLQAYLPSICGSLTVFTGNILALMLLYYIVSEYVFVRCRHKSERCICFTWS